MGSAAGRYYREKEVLSLPFHRSLDGAVEFDRFVFSIISSTLLDPLLPLRELFHTNLSILLMK
jgi:hypothetical protein